MNIKNNLLIVFIAVFLFIVGISFFLYFYQSNYKVENKPEVQTVKKIRIGWQIPWAVEGQLTLILKNTDFLKNNKLSGDFTGFSSGAPLNEAALARQVDVIFTGDQPAATLLSKDPNWVIIGRLMYNRVSLYVPPKSTIKNASDLRGKTVAMPFGAAAQRLAYKTEKDAGLDPTRDVKNINLGIYEQSDLVKDPTVLKWGDIDALAGFDPTPAIFEEKGLTRNLATGKVVSVIMMSKDFIKQYPDAPVNFLKAFNEAYSYYQTNTIQADDWFVKESKLNISSKALKIASEIEPNLSGEAIGNIRLGFTDEDYNSLQEAADFIFEQSLIKAQVNMKDYIDMSYLQKASLK